MSSRLIFRNLPNTLETSSFKTHLLQPTQLADTTLTDLKLVSKRRFAFVGYKDEEEAKRAKEWFDGTFVGSGKIKVEFVDDETLAKKQGKSLSFKPAQTKQESEKPKPKRKNKQFEEFISVMKGSDANAIPVPVPEPKADSASGVVQVEDVKQDDTGDLDDAEWLKRRQAAVVPESTGEEGVGESSTMQVDHDKRLAPEEILIRQTHRLFLRNLSFHTTTDSLRSYLSTYGPISEIHLPLSKTTKEPLGTAFVKFENAEDAVKVWQEVDGRTVMGRLIHVLPGRGKPGEQVIIPRSGNVSGSLGVEEVDSGTHANDGGLFGKVLGKEEGKNVKSEVDKRGKTESSKGLNWATLYMNSDAVASSVADRMGIKKSDILNSDALLPEETEGEERRGKEVNGAVKLALAETSVINETKKYFETHGVILTRLEGSSDVAEGMKGGKRTIVPRSKTTLLVKNIPYGTTLDVLRALFEPFGTLKRALMPPAGTLAVVEFEEAADAAGAFKGVSYKRLGNAVIYLEKAPEGLMRDVGDVGVEEETRGIEGNEAAEVLKRVEAAAAARGGDKEEEEPLTEAGSTLYVKNLSFNTTTERLESVFSSLPSFSFARVSTKPDPKNPTARLSMGFGFLGFKTKDAANRALKGLKGYKLDGHQLEVKFAQRDREGDEVEGKKGGASEGKKGKTTKMIVKNVPFEASKKDIRDLFSAYGSLKSCRIPKKHNSGGRGFAFLDFTTRTEAEAAMEALKHTHLLGRHLVLEWAAEEEFADKEVERLREKAKREFVKDGEGLPSKKRKLGLKDGLAADQADEE